MKLFWAFTRQAFHNITIYRSEFWMRFIAILVGMYGITFVWHTLYQQSPGAFNVSAAQMITYGVLARALDLMLDVGPEWYISEQVRSGKIDSDLMKPLDFQLYMLARSSGEMLFSLGILAIPTMAIGYFAFGLILPATAQAALMFAASVLFAFLVFFNIGFLFGLLSIITQDIRSIGWAYYSVVYFAAGQLVPLWLFPDWLLRVVEWLPFQSIYYIPVSIYIGTFSGAAAWRALGTQLFWVVALAVVARLAWGGVHKRLISQGG